MCLQTKTMRLLLFGTLLALSLCQVSVVSLTADEIEAERSGWNVNPETQYHVQTDEGPERYFRFQTLNGQYRKEKRLEDGTVIGTEGWLDPLGYLRIKDYIADAKGFRILKSKMIFVGKDRPISDAVSISKSAPASGGALARPVRPPNPFRQPELKDVSSNSIEANSVTSSRHRSYVSSTPLPPSSSSCIGLRPIAVTTLRPRPFSLTTSSPSGDGYKYEQPNGNYLPSINYKSYRKPALLVEPPYLEQDQNHLGSHSTSVRVTPRTVFRGYRRWNGTTSSTTSPSSSTVRVVARRRSSQQQRTASASSGYKEYKFPSYDGTSRTGDNGFQYYLKKQYHEEERARPDKAVGSFGYVDPFGIRRVVYYKADGANGFVHRKNNRYVGHEASPYDPVPVAQEHAMH
ncbi:uncharacterized protein LOC131669999 [Phymastichus coffea]|uniref:uncharacterized protein LOC131669999 n=1 Tax=Phymastichus coffea TaxID=108790 RepID=UPI00273ADC4E|nr:uncharacterized protein LOC131669999 [Phymastichus coffea]